MTWWFTPARLCFFEKFVAPSERQFQGGIRVPSTAKEPGAFRLSLRGLFSGSRTLVSAFSMVVMVLQTLGWDTLKMRASSSSVMLCRW